jgi:hypothetical protein
MLFVCECCFDDCTGTVSLSSAESEEIRRRPTCLVVVPGHVDPEVERVVGGAADRYEIVEKTERAAELVAQMHPRSQQN